MRVKSQKSRILKWPLHVGEAMMILNTEYDIMVVLDLVGSSFVLSQCVTICSCTFLTV